RAPHPGFGGIEIVEGPERDVARVEERLPDARHPVAGGAADNDRPAGAAERGLLRAHVVGGGPDFDGGRRSAQAAPVVDEPGAGDPGGGDEGVDRGLPLLDRRGLIAFEESDALVDTPGHRHAMNPTYYATSRRQPQAGVSANEDPDSRSVRPSLLGRNRVPDVAIELPGA